MYKIYIGDIPVLLVSDEFEIESMEGAHLIQYLGDKKQLLEWIEKIEGEIVGVDLLVIQCEDVEQLKNDFFGCYKVLKAGGGVVYNTKNEILAIYRRGHWDLPKGKQDPGESIEDTAVREVQEETGIKNIELGKFITNTYHTYNNRKGKRCMKYSIWYEMHTPDSKLKPQVEEDIEEAVWMSKEELIHKTPIYKNILEVLNQL